MKLPTTVKYKGRELYKRNNFIHYGRYNDKFIAVFKVISTTEYKGLQIASPVTVELQINNPNLTIREKIVKKTEAENLLKALEIADVWLTQANGN